MTVGRDATLPALVLNPWVGSAHARHEPSDAPNRCPAHARRAPLLANAARQRYRDVARQPSCSRARDTAHLHHISIYRGITVSRIDSVVAGLRTPSVSGSRPGVEGAIGGAAVNAVVVGGTVWALAVLIGLLAVAWVAHHVHRWAHRARQRRRNRRMVARHQAQRRAAGFAGVSLLPTMPLPILERAPGRDRVVFRVRGSR